MLPPRRCLIVILALSACGQAPAHAGDDTRQLAFGKHLAQQCTACHRLDGAPTAGIPAIVGWPADQFAVVLGSYKNGDRKNEAMVSITATLGDEELAALAAYFGSLKSAPAQPTPGKKK